MTGWKTCAHKALEQFSKALYGTTGSTYSARVVRPVMLLNNSVYNRFLIRARSCSDLLAYEE